MRATALVLFVLALAAFAGACAKRAPILAERPVAKASAAPSNILRGDYAGSAACKECHAKEHEAWARSPMHRMTRDAATAEIYAPFDGAALHFKSDVITLESLEGRR